MMLSESIWDESKEMPAEYEDRLLLCEDIVRRSLKHLLETVTSTDILQPPYGRLPDPTPLVSEKQFLSGGGLRFVKEDISMDEPPFSYSFGFNPLKTMAESISRLHPDTISELRNDRFHAFSKLVKRSGNARNSLSMGRFLKGLSTNLLSGIVWGPLTSPVSPTSTLLSCQACRDGEIIIQLSLTSSFNEICDSWEQMVYDPTQPVKVTLTDLTPGREYFVRCCLKDIDRNNAPPSAQSAEEKEKSGSAGGASLPKRTKKANNQQKPGSGADVSAPTPRSTSRGGGTARNQGGGTARNQGAGPAAAAAAAGLIVPAAAQRENIRFQGVDGGVFNESRFVTLPLSSQGSLLRQQSWTSPTSGPSDSSSSGSNSNQKVKPSASRFILVAIPSSSIASNYYLPLTSIGQQEEQQKQSSNSLAKQKGQGGNEADTNAVPPVITGCLLGDVFHHHFVPSPCNAASAAVGSGSTSTNTTTKITTLKNNSGITSGAAVNAEDNLLKTKKFYDDQAFSLLRNFPLFHSQDSILRKSSFICALHDRFLNSDDLLRQEEAAYRQHEHDLRKFQKKYGNQDILNSNSNVATGGVVTATVPAPPRLRRPSLSPSLDAVQKLFPLESVDRSTRSFFRSVAMGPQVEVFILDTRCGYLGKEQIAWITDSIQGSSAKWKIVMSGCPVLFTAATATAAKPSSSDHGDGDDDNNHDHLILENAAANEEDDAAQMSSSSQQVLPAAGASAGARVSIKAPPASTDAAAATTAAASAGAATVGPGRSSKSSLLNMVSELQTILTRSSSEAAAANTESRPVTAENDNKNASGGANKRGPSSSYNDDNFSKTASTSTRTVNLEFGLIFLTSGDSPSSSSSSPAEDIINVPAYVATPNSGASAGTTNNNSILGEEGTTSATTTTSPFFAEVCVGYHSSSNSSNSGFGGSSSFPVPRQFLSELTPATGAATDPPSLLFSAAAALAATTDANATAAAPPPVAAHISLNSDSSLTVSLHNMVLPADNNDSSRDDGENKQPQPLPLFSCNFRVRT